MRNFFAILLATSVFATGAFAAGVETSATLTPGKPATVKQAQMEGNGVLLLVGAAIVVGGIALVASGDGQTNITATTTATAP